MASLYEINLKREILADYDKYLDENNISYESLNPIRVLEKIISEIYRNIFKPEYENIEKLNEAKNYQKQRVKVAKIHEKIMNMRTDFLNKLSTYIIKNHDRDINASKNILAEGLRMRTIGTTGIAW